MKKLTLFLLIGCALVWSSCNDNPRCNDGIQNGEETEVDCGGPCPECYTCNDGFQNQGEVGIDCGGPCDRCPDQWEEIFSEQFVQSARFVDAQTAYGYLPSTVLKTTDGGYNWTEISPISGATFQVEPVSADRCFLLNQSGGAFRILITKNGGQSWETCNMEPLSDNVQRILISFADSNRGVMAMTETFDHTFWRTSDGGQTWTKTFSLSSVQPAQIPSEANAIMAHLQAFASGRVIGLSHQVTVVSTDFGQTWSATLNTQAGLRLGQSAYWANEQIGYMEGVSLPDNSLDIKSFKTTDGGQTWTAWQNLQDFYDLNPDYNDPNWIIPAGTDTLFYFYNAPHQQLQPTVHPQSFTSIASMAWIKTPGQPLRPVGKIALNSAGAYAVQYISNTCFAYSLSNNRIYRLKLD